MSFFGQSATSRFVEFIHQFSTNSRHRSDVIDLSKFSRHFRRICDVVATLQILQIFSSYSTNLRPCRFVEIYSSILDQYTTSLQLLRFVNSSFSTIFHNFADSSTFIRHIRHICDVASTLYIRRNLFVIFHQSATSQRINPIIKM